MADIRTVYTLDTMARELNRITYTLAKRLMPTNMKEVLGWAAEMWMRCPPYRQAIRKGCSYFLTKISMSAPPGSDVGKDKIREASRNMNRMFATSDQASLAMQEALGFGGCCLYLHFPINRRLVCSCGHTIPLEKALREDGFAFKTVSNTYAGSCPVCKKGLNIKATDSRLKDDVDKAKLRRIPLQICRMEFNPATGSRRLFVNMKDWEGLEEGITSANPMFLAETPGMFIESVLHNREIMLSEKYFHYLGFEDASVIDVQLKGRSLPPFFYAFPDVIAILLLQNYNETLLSDYIEPKRYVAPPSNINAARILPNAGGFDATHMLSSRDFASKIGAVVAGMRNNPGKIAVLPFPIESGYIGADANQLLTVQLMDHYVESLLNDMGIPVEFYKGGITAQVATPSHYGFVLYEKSWAPLVGGIHNMYQWVSDRMQESRGEAPLDALLVPPSRAADPALIQIYYQRVQEGRMTNATFDDMIGVNTEFEAQGVEDEVDEQIEKDMKRQKDDQRKALVNDMLAGAGPMIQAYDTLMAAQQQGQAPGGTPSGGMPPVGSPGTVAVSSGSVLSDMAAGAPGSPVDAHAQQVTDALSAKADETARMLVQYPIPERAELLRKMEASNPTWHMFVQTALAEVEKEAEKQGLMAARGQGGPTA